MTVPDRNGFRKVRPAILLTPTEEVEGDQPLVFVAVTTSFPDPPPKDHVLLPWNSDPRRARTGLGRRSAAVLSWVLTGYVDEIESVIGELPFKTLSEIQRRIRDP